MPTTSSDPWDWELEYGLGLLQDLVNNAKEAISNAFETTKEFVNDVIIEPIKNTLGGSDSGSSGSIVDVLVEATDDPWQKAWDTVTNDVPQWVKDRLSELGNAINSIWDTINGIKNAILNLPAIIFNAIGEAAKGVADFFGKMLDSVMQGLYNFTGPLAPIVLISVGFGTIIAIIWLIKKTIGKYVPFI